MVQRRRKTRHLEADLLRIRSLLDSPIGFHIRGEADRKFAVRLQAAEPRFAELAALLRPLGDLVIVPEGRDPLGVMRLFVDESGTIMAAAFVAGGVPPELVITIESYRSDGENWTTTRSSRHVEDMPFEHKRHVAEAAAPAFMVEAHRAHVLGVPTKTLAIIRTREDAIAVLGQTNQRTKEWRSAQSPDALLERDLRQLLKNDFARTGKQWQRRLDRLRTKSVPVATLRRK